MLTTAQLAEVTGVDRRVWWEVARGETPAPFPIAPIRVGAQVLRWPTAPVLRALGVNPDASTVDATTSAAGLTLVASDTRSRDAS